MHARENKPDPWKLLTDHCHPKGHPWGAVILVYRKRAFEAFRRLRMDVFNVDAQVADAVAWIEDMNAYRYRARRLGLPLPHPFRLHRFIEDRKWKRVTVPSLDGLKQQERRMELARRQAEKEGRRYVPDITPLADQERYKHLHARGLQVAGMERQPGETPAEYAARCRRAALGMFKRQGDARCE